MLHYQELHQEMIWW